MGGNFKFSMGHGESELVLENNNPGGAPLLEIINSHNSVVFQQQGKRLRWSSVYVTILYSHTLEEYIWHPQRA